MQRNPATVSFLTKPLLDTRPNGQQHILTRYFQVKMRVNSLSISLASASILVALIPGTHARGLPNWLQAKRQGLQDVKNLPRQYNAYNSPPVGYGYTYPGSGPLPTVPQTSPSSLPTATSENSGEATSSDFYSGKRDPNKCVATCHLPVIYQSLPLKHLRPAY